MLAIGMVWFSRKPLCLFIMMTSGPNGAGAHFVEYTIVAYRKSNNKRVTIEDSTFLDLA